MRKVHTTDALKAFLTEVRRRRRELRIKQEVLALELGLTQSGYSKIERGSSKIKVETGIFLRERLQIEENSNFIP